MYTPQGIHAGAKINRIKWWQIALIAVGVSLLGRLSSGQTKSTEQKLYNFKLKQAPWAPPAWLFGVAWPINNFFILLALQYLLSGQQTAEKKKLLLLQAAIWTIFFSFGYVYFRKKSSILAAIWTVSDAAVSIASFIIARKVDKKLSYYYLPLVIWTSYASTVAVYQALENDDPVLNVSAPLD